MHGLSWESGAEAIAGFEREIDGLLGQGLAALENTLVAALQHQHQLFLPGASTFDMTNPLYNARGDLLVTLKYKEYVLLLSLQLSSPVPKCPSCPIIFGGLLKWRN